MKRALLLAALAALVYSCAPSTEEMDEDPSVEEQEQPVTTETFGCHDKYGNWCGPVNRTDNRWAVFQATPGTHVQAYGDAPNEGVDDFWIYSARSLYITRNANTGSTDAVQWNIAFPAGSTCNTWGNCRYYVCAAEGFAWNHCYESMGKSGATSSFNGTYIPGGAWLRWQLVVWIVAGPNVGTDISSSWLYLWHTPL